MASTRLFQTDDAATGLDELRQRLGRHIEEAFADTPYPGDNHICKPDVDGSDLVRAFRGQDWRDLQLNTITNYHVDMALMTPEAFRYYLPAFMLAVVFYYGHVSTLPMGLMHSLTPPDAGLLQKYLEKKTDPLKHTQIGDFLNRVSAFTPREKSAIRTFLETYRKLQPQARGETRHLDRAAEFWKTA
ncbi:MAG: DUF6714 family protein [Anaerolineae bacterium]